MEPQRRPSFSITFSFTDFTPGRNLDREQLADQIFDHLIQGGVDAEGAWSIDGWDAK